MGNFLNNNKDWAISAIRICTGLLMVVHGYEVFNDKLLSDYSNWDQFKGFSYPKLMVTIGKATEFVAGLLLVLGIFTRIGSLLLILSMLYITFFVGNGAFFNGDQHPFLFVLLGIIYFFVGGGPFSLDKFFSKK